MLLERVQARDLNDLETFLARGGWDGPQRARDLSPLEVVVALRRSGLLDYASGGQPVYLPLWSFTQRGDEGLLVADGRELDPDGRVEPALLSRDPYGLLAGLAVAASATGASQARLLLGPRGLAAQEDLLLGLQGLAQRGLLAGGELEIQVVEQTSQPPAVPGQSELRLGLQTWYQIGQILAQEDQQLRAGGRLLSVWGAVARPGLVELPAGAPLSQALEQAGGLADPGTAKALVMDQGLRGFLPLEQAGIPLAPEELMSAGVHPGFSSLLVADWHHCLVDLTRRALIRLLKLGVDQDEASRGLILHAVRLTTEISLRRSQDQCMEQLETLAGQLRLMGSPGAWPLLNSLATFRSEWEVHLRGESCPAVDCLRPLVAPCQNTCPAGIDIAGFIALLGQGRPRQSLEVILQDNPLPYICGLICPAPCEQACARSGLDAPISIKSLKAVAARQALEQGGYPKPAVAADTGQRVAVIGSGPAGLTAAYYLAIRGHRVIIFEALPVAGGMLRVGIPAYRLPRQIIDQEIDFIKSVGVEIRLNSPLGPELTLEDLKQQGFNAVFLSCGAHKGLRLGMEGENLPGVQSGVEFLREAALGQAACPGQKVVVLGGGNVAMDAARTALRLGSQEVTILYRRSRAEMPAHHQEIEEALEEGIKIKYLAAPTSLRAQDGALSGMEVIAMELGDPDESGRRRPKPVQGSEHILECDGVLTAIGQQPDLDCLGPDSGLEVGRGSRLTVDPFTLQTSLEWVFAGGDVVLGPATVVEAIAQGKRAARSMDAYLREQPLETMFTYAYPKVSVEPLMVPAAEKARLHRPQMPLRPAGQRRGDFEPVEMGLTDQMGLDEARRCLRCDLCIGCGLCQTACQEMGVGALQFSQAGPDRLALLDFHHASQNCVGCGACAQACPKGAITVTDSDGRRTVSLAGTVLKELDLLPCSQCGTPYVPREYLEHLGQRMDGHHRATSRLETHVCPACARQAQTRQRWARRFTLPGSAPTIGRA